ncbi:MAG TPA: Asp-tRNA(Asn)/Glu-tRNA(Gln) amidotransferase subunit GatC [Atribacterota bacterium]|nr:Asp-tRNA(Asn)/Glu-tRNA(Gln) amidotransferase subunit GatC [Atribacterota bacterium]HOR42229.1 Asp-tRNA(Asn)/Glu-tRNA(Gln) amidotransferase subunit GatC [Atribacterota bacterium]HPK87133.1 Asp-tRNA(Asn)/Glu-tRNA(Gln) amidotransferase subunit GatC [Atribacterota bacterium]
MEKKLVTQKEVEELAESAKLELDEMQKEQFCKRLNDFLHCFSQFRELNIAHVLPTIQIAHYAKHFHEDMVKPSLSQSEVLAMTNHRENGYFRVPRIL